ncbi:unnamed protein product [Dibothriocephalus latus]|uniref:NF-X1-type domain-containing protein n=1 Tax=Dibothriocephalus latus TaxID=60516 RepID=A0A3P7NTT8_DIBLA|nr:unnamed protein product [Dibothriocephalus latus]
MYHLKCMTEWALSAKLGKQDPNERISAPKNTWRCPSCQKEHSSTNKPLIYRCFCGRKIRPEYHPGHTTIPHGCDEICGKQRKTKEAEEGAQACPHACTELCHPGPCPPCVSTVDMSCPCGRVVRRARCGERPPSPCVCYCGRLDELTICGGEKARRYHLEGVDPLEDELDACDLECLSEADAAVARRYNVLDRALFVGTVFSCEQPCGRMLNCRHHKCQALCHPGDCQPCQLLPEFCLTCPCGRVPLSKLVRKSYCPRKLCGFPLPLPLPFLSLLLLLLLLLLLSVPFPPPPSFRTVAGVT